MASPTKIETVDTVSDNQIENILYEFASSNTKEFCVSNGNHLRKVIENCSLTVPNNLLIDEDDKDTVAGSYIYEQLKQVLKNCGKEFTLCVKFNFNLAKLANDILVKTCSAEMKLQSFHRLDLEPIEPNRSVYQARICVQCEDAEEELHTKYVAEFTKWVLTNPEKHDVQFEDSDHWKKFNSESELAKRRISTHLNLEFIELYNSYEVKLAAEYV